MANREFVPVTWNSDQLIDEDSLDQINSNLIYLRDQSIDGKYQHLNGGVTDLGLKMVAGRKVVTARKSDRANVRITFPSMFTPGTIPIVVVTPTCANPMNIFTNVTGIGQVQPNHNGFEVAVSVAADKKENDRISQTIYLNWIAFGY